MSKAQITQDLVRELLNYDAHRGVLTWRPRGRKWFKNSGAQQRWNARHADKPAFTFVHRGMRWGCILNHNQLAHRVAWLYVHGCWPRTVRLANGDATDIRLCNMIDRGAKHQVRERVRIAA